MKLYEIRQDYLATLQNLESMDDISAEVITDTLSVIADDFDTKALNVAAYIKTIEAEMVAMKEYEEGMYQRRKSHQRRIDSLKNYLLTNMQAIEVSTVKGIESTIRTFERARVKVNEDILSANFFNEKITRIPDLMKISKSIKEGILVEGAWLEPSFNVVIK